MTEETNPKETIPETEENEQTRTVKFVPPDSTALQEVAPAEWEAFRAWQAQKDKAAPSEATEESVPSEETDSADNLKLENAGLKAKIEALSKGIPPDKTTQYLKLAEAYQNDEIDLAAALDKALIDFPLSGSGVPGSGGNPALIETKSSEQTYLDNKYKGNPYYKE